VIVSRRLWKSAASSTNVAASNGKETPKAVFRAVTDARLEETKFDPSHARGVRARGDAVGAASRSGRAIGGIALWSIARRTW